jgi:hypothetical protein
MGKRASDLQKAVFLTYLQYVSKVEATRKIRLTQQTANDIKRRAIERKAIHEELGLRPPTIEQ